MLSEEERLKYYIGDFYEKNDINISNDILEKYKIFKQNGIYFYLGPSNYPEDFKFKYGCVTPGWWWGNNNGFIIDIAALVNSADGYESDKLPVLTKARKIGEENNGILVKFEHSYHWNIIASLKDPYKWNDKINSIVWRGNSYTGSSKKSNRKLFVSQYYEKYNVGFVDSVKNSSIYEEQNKDKMTQEEQLKYKYLICLEGNDVGTSVKWSLFSNSIVIMAKPVIEGWLMEGLLEPYVHYVPLKDDFSDLEDIIKWCINNDDKCKDIAINSTKWMSQFLDNDKELRLHNYIKDWYIKNCHFQYLP